MKKFTDVNTVKTRQNVGISFILTCFHFAHWFGHTIANGINFNRIQDGASLNSSCLELKISKA